MHISPEGQGLLDFTLNRHLSNNSNKKYLKSTSTSWGKEICCCCYFRDLDGLELIM